jgi:hypothetical protein
MNVSRSASENAGGQDERMIITQDREIPFERFLRLLRPLCLPIRRCTWRFTLVMSLEVDII